MKPFTCEAVTSVWFWTLGYERNHRIGNEQGEDREKAVSSLLAVASIRMAG